MTDTISIQIKIKAATSFYIQDDSVNYRLQNTKSPQSHSIFYLSHSPFMQNKSSYVLPVQKYWLFRSLMIHVQ